MRFTEGLANKPEWRIVPIAQSSERYMLVRAMLRFKLNGGKKCEWFKVKFIDTLQLLDCSLAVLEKNLSTDYSLMPHTMAMKLQYPSITDYEL